MKQVFSGASLSAFGDSFTMGYNATSMNGYAQRFAAFIGGSLSNYGLGSSLSTYSAKKGLEVLPEGYRRQVVTWMAGLNDIRGGGAAAIPKIQGNLRAFLAACFLDDCLPASALRKTGTWYNLSNSYGGKSYYAGGNAVNTYSNINAALEYDFYGDNCVIFAYRTNGTTGYYQDLSVSVDGGTPQTFALFGQTNEQVSHDAFVISGLGEGPHTLKIMPTTTAAHTVVDAVGTLKDHGSPVLVSHIPYLLNWAQYSSIATQAICDSANAAIDDVVAEFAGYSVEIVPVNDFYDPATGCSSDGIHPTDFGHECIADAFKAHINLV